MPQSPKQEQRMAKTAMCPGRAVVVIAVAARSLMKHKGVSTSLNLEEIAQGGE